jgi:hypothetical protein
MLGPVTNVDYYPRVSDTVGQDPPLVGTDRFNDYTHVIPYTGAAYDFCGDKMSTFHKGAAYRIEVAYQTFSLLHGPEVFPCFTVQHIETVNPTPDLQEMYGEIVEVSHLGRYEYAFDVRIKTDIENGYPADDKTETLNLCNNTNESGMADEIVGPSRVFGSPLYTSEQLDKTAQNNKISNKQSPPTITTIFYNKADRSSRYGCYPLLAIRIEDANHPDNRPVLVLPNVQRYFHEDNPEFLQRLEPHFYGD